MTRQNESVNKKGTFLVLWLLCILGSWSMLPYVQHLGVIPSTVPLYQIFLLVTVQALFIFGLVCWLSYLIVPKTDLTPFSCDRPLTTIIYPGVIAGGLVGVAIYLIDAVCFNSSLLSGTHPPFWTGFLASFYGAINEEVLLRLFMFTFIYFIFGKLFKFDAHNRLPFLWVTNVIVAILFGIGHLPAAFKLAIPTSLEVFRVLLLNGMAGILFGWLYWSRGLWAAMTAHFVADLVIHVLLT